MPCCFRLQATPPGLDDTRPILSFWPCHHRELLKHTETDFDYKNNADIQATVVIGPTPAPHYSQSTVDTAAMQTHQLHSHTANWKGDDKQETTRNQRATHRADEVGLVVVVGCGVGLACIWRPVELVVLADEHCVHIIRQVCTAKQQSMFSFPSGLWLLSICP